MVGRLRRTAACRSSRGRRVRVGEVMMQKSDVDCSQRCLLPKKKKKDPLMSRTWQKRGIRRSCGRPSNGVFFYAASPPIAPRRTVSDDSDDVRPSILSIIIIILSPRVCCVVSLALFCALFCGSERHDDRRRRRRIFLASPIHHPISTPASQTTSDTLSLRIEYYYII